MKMRSVLLYLSLVGLPLLGIAGALNLGQGIKPPLSVAGTWDLDLQPPASCSLDCSHERISTGAVLLKIAQSGPDLVLNLNDPLEVELTGIVSEMTVEARDIASSCLLQAGVDREPRSDRMIGRLILTRCKRPNGLSFTAVRRDLHNNPAGGH